MKHIYLLLAVLVFSLTAQADDCYNGRYKDHVFTEYEVIKNVIYDRKQKSGGGWQNLYYDVYLPKGDEETNRPAVFLAHGGGFIDLMDQRSPDIVRLAQDLVLRGYVVFSVEYREEPTFFSLLSEEKMVKALGRALIDIRDATCSLMDTTLNHDNPWGVNHEKVIIGGVSAGAVSILQAVFLDSLTWVPQQYQEWLLEIEPNTQALLDDKYCGANVLGVINISGAILDTNWIKPDKADEYPPIMHIHGTADPIVPYNIARPFGLATLPKLMGSFPIDQKLQQIGVRSELDTWQGLGHVPILGINFQALFSPNPINVIFNPIVLDTSLIHMGEFCYSLIECNERTTEAITGIDQSKASSLNFYPNPNNGNFYVQLPEINGSISGTLKIINSAGQAVFGALINSQDNEIKIQQDLVRDYYSVVVNYDGPLETNYFVGQLVVSW